MRPIGACPQREAVKAYRAPIVCGHPEVGAFHPLLFRQNELTTEVALSDWRVFGWIAFGAPDPIRDIDRRRCLPSADRPFRVRLEFLPFKLLEKVFGEPELRGAGQMHRFVPG